MDWKTMLAYISGSVASERLTFGLGSQARRR